MAQKPYKIGPPDQFGWCDVRRRSDNACLGRVQKDSTDPKLPWSGRFYHDGGGTTTEGFKTPFQAADYVWDEYHKREYVGIGET